MKTYIKYLSFNILIVFGLGFIQHYIIFPPFYLHYYYYIIPVLIAAILAIFPTLLEERAKFCEERLKRLKKKSSKTDLKKIEKNLELINKAKYDSLTKAMNKGSFNEIIGYKIIESKHFKTPLSIIIFDIDFFKKINDTYGHPVGDKVLSELADVIRENIRKSENFVRWGGEEFIILLQNTSLYNAKMVAEKLRQVLENHRFNKVGKVTCSFGVTQLKNDDTIETFISRVDRALYNAKERGRNRVEVLK
ncbi:GGDEF domain-containing protein [Nitrosophilus labii]|uniref:GGDEF domain-containing protein n=1 Tax=Nitrosophilus labii TaxID=2706014 RepID=UPI0016573913|nr:GGDEF domain-containing protein [Nitrosophilus labii]